MRGLGLFAVLLWTLVAPEISQAARSDVTCLQNQLKALGHDPGPIDGLMGGKTRRAYAALNRARGENAFDLNLSSNSALVICRELGAEQIALRKFWPEHPRRFSTKISDELPKRTRGKISEVTAVFLSELGQETGIRLARPVEIFATSDNKVLLREMRRTVSRRSSRANSRAYLKTVCGEDLKIGGFANRDRVFICFPGGPLRFQVHNRDRNLEGRRNFQQLRHVVQHEIVHAVQFQLAGAKPFFRSGLDRSMGPRWLIEGSAEYLSVLSLSRYEMKPDVTRKIRRELEKKSYDLSTLARASKDPEKTTALYLQGFLAASLLVERHGPASLLEFYRAMGLGLSWQAAFKATFGQDVGAFYEDYAAAFDTDE